MELVFRQRLDRPDAKGRCAVFADLHWAGGNRWKVPTGVKCLPAHWQPAKTKRVATAADDAVGANLRLNRLVAAVDTVFRAAELALRPEASVTSAEVQQAVRAGNAGSRRKEAPTPPPAPDPNAPLPATASWQELYDAWLMQNQARLAPGTLVGFQQVVPQLERFDAELRISTLTQARIAQYTAYLYAQGKKDATVATHYWFLRECFQLVGRAVPKAVKRFSIRTGRSLSLQRPEVLAWVALTPPAGPFAEERDAFLFQLLLLLRDSDLRALRPYHVRPHELDGIGPWPCVALHQQKTSEEVIIPLPPLAITIWERYQGHLPVRDNSNRIKLIKSLGEMAGLTREFVDVAFSGPSRLETVRPVHEAMSTHTARHTGAALLVWATDGDQGLKECALGHTSDSPYGHDTVNRYGPRLLAAWRQVLGDAVLGEPPEAGAFPRIAPAFGKQRRYSVPLPK